MKRFTLIILVGLFAVLVIGVFVVINNSETEDNAESLSPINSQSSDSESSPATSGSANLAISDQNYIEYSPDALKDTDNAETKRVLFFHAEWCSTCKFFESDIMEVGIPEGLVIIEADYDNETELKQQYGVSVQSTFVLIDANGEILKTWPFASGLSSAQDLYSAISAET